MTSRSSSSKKLASGKWFLFDCIKRTQWVPIISLVAFLLIFVLQGVMRIQNVQEYIDSTQKTSRQITEAFMQTNCAEVGRILQGGNRFATLTLVLLATASAFSAFQYLHSKQKIDLYHSLAISRGKQFICRYISGLINVLVPFMLSFAILLAVIYGVGFAPYVGMEEIALYFFVSLATAFAVYTFAVLSMILCGNTFVSLLMHAWVLFSPIVIRLCIESCMHEFLQTYYGTIQPLASKKYSVVVSALYYYSYSYSTSPYEPGFGRRDVVMLFAVYCLIALVVCLLAYWLFKRRRSESAGNAIAFPIIKVPLRIYMGTVLGATAGAFLSNGIGWMVVGAIIGVVICHMIVSVVYTFDYRKIFAQPLYIPVCIVIVLLFGSIFKFDVFGYDSWLPDMNKVEAVGVGNGVRRPVLVNEGTISLVHEIAVEGVEQLDRVEDTTAQYRYTAVSFKMKNGKTKIRGYYVPVKYSNMVRDITQTEEYKKSYWRLYQLDSDKIHAASDADSLYVTVSVYNKSQEVKNVDQFAEIWSTLQEEALTRPEVVKPVMTVSVDLNDSYGKYFWTYATVMESDVKTLALIQQYTGIEPVEITVNDVKQMSMDWIIAEEVQNDDGNSAVRHTNYTAKITDPSLITAVLEHGFIDGFDEEEGYIANDAPSIWLELQNGSSCTINFNYLDYPVDVIDKCFEQAEKIGEDWY